MRFLAHLSLAAPFVNAASLYSSGAGRSPLAARTTISNPPATSSSSTVPDFSAAWDAAYAKAKVAVAKMSLTDKVTLTTGTGLGAGTCSGNIPAISSINFPGLCLEDGPMAMRPANFSTVFPAGVNTAATFNRQLIRARGVALGAEFAGKGVNVAFGPSVQIARTPTGGRSWEGFGADPFLSGEAGYETILGMQSSKVQANVKHFLGKYQEFARFSESSDIDDRTAHEIYGHPFMRAVMAGVSSVMCAENRVNGTYSCGNDEIQNKLLRKEWGFRGYVLSDFLANRATSDAVNGLDMSLPGNAAQVTIPVSSAYIDPVNSYFGSTLASAVTNGTVPASQLDAMVTRILAGWYLLNQDNGQFTGPQYTKDVRADHATVARQVAAASHILLKNTKNALPLTKAKLGNGILVAGSDARAPSSLWLISAYVGALNDGTLAMGWGSGAGTLTTLAAPLDSLTTKAQADGTTISAALDDWNPAAAAAAAVGKSAALVFIKSASGEGHIRAQLNSRCRSNISAWNNGDNMVKAVAAVNPNTIVIIHSVGTIDMEAWINNPNVSAVVLAGIPGQESGNALVDVLYGTVNPSGRLPYTIAKQLSDYPAQVNHGTGDINGLFSIPYSEKLLVDYRHFDAKNITPRFEFGYGLSYTYFSYSALTITRSIQPLGSTLGTKWLAGLTVPGASSSTAAWSVFHTPIVTVKFNLKNTGIYAGSEIPQLYLHFPSSAGEPPSVLKAFDSIKLNPGQNTTVTLTLTAHSFSVWDTVGQGWKRPSGQFTLHVGASSRDFRLYGVVPTN
ncbi:glycoside hydrolase family 3 protein [Exidia glandulosa HHB12029]|uniref:beta-glucosidase n=1 Tax=Exidia glandulosa HHB12029 TaxID=1314781 RepID=A0A165D8X8_EXIGL|nr:glycoside hydrolase family 3 protein [Exidia glandulosa HHB12029]